MNLFGFLAALLALEAGNVVQAQYSLSIDVVEEHTGLVGTDDLTGYTTYRLYLDTESPTDFVSAVFGDAAAPLQLAVDGGDLYNCEFAMGSTADGVNPAFFPYFPQLQYDSWVTIGIDRSPMGNQTSISTIQSPDEPWGNSLNGVVENPQGLSLSSLSGGVWYILNGSPNGIAGIDQRVLIAQLTTNGTLSGTLNIQIFPQGVGQDEFVLTQSFSGTEVFDPIPQTLPSDCPGAFNCVPEGDGSTACDYPFFFGVDEADYYGPGVNTLDELTAEAGSLPVGVSDNNMSTYYAVGTSNSVSSVMSFYTPNDAAALTNVSGASYTVDAGYAPDGSGGMTADASWSAAMYLNLGTYDFADLTVEALLDFNPASGNDDSTYYAFNISSALASDVSLSADTTNSYLSTFTWTDDFWAATGDLAVTGFGPFDPTVGGEYGFKLRISNACNEVVMEHAILLTAVAGGEGCMVPGACNYDPTATIPGACDYFSCIGCTDVNACNFDPEALYNDGSCEYTSCIAYGCTNVNACNYDPEATQNDGSCDYASCVGCTNPDATNYDPDATIDSGQCTVPGCVVPTACNFNPEATVSDGSCEYLTCAGCMNMTACNFDPEATLPDLSACVFPATYYDCSGACLNDSDGDGVCDPLEIAGCTDPGSDNYDPAATDDDGSCTNGGAGCVIPSACNYDPTATVNDGSCEFESCAGCTNPVACNYDSTATLTDNTQCEYPATGYDCAGACLLDGDSDGVCDPFEIYGCTDPLANNFDASATEENSTCTYDPVCNDPEACNYDSNWGYCIQVDTVVVHTGMVGDVDLSGYTTYRIYALCQNPDDFVSGVFGDNNASTVISSSTDFYQDPFGGGLATSINPLLLPYFPAMSYDSWVTIGVDSQENADNGEGPVNVIAGPTNPWLSNFENGGDILIDDATGGGWFNLQGVTNGVAGDDLRVLLGQFTTDGMLDGQLFVQFFKYIEGGVQEVTISTDIGGACSFPQYDGCEFPEPGYTCAGDCIADSDGDGICDANEVPGCEDALACNYNANATDPAACEYAEPEYDCDGNCLVDTDGDGVCNAFEVPGCMDVSACNFDEAATNNNGSCEYPTPGYDCAGNCLLDSDGDGICDWLEVSGCQDPVACNFDANATDPGSCSYAAAGYDCDGVCLVDSDGDGVCDAFEVVGCQDVAACNFDPLATDEDDSCAYAEFGLDCDGNCLEDADGDGVCDEDEIPGCTDATALNFNATATDDDGSCTYPCAPDLTPPSFVFVPNDSTVTCDQDMPTTMALAVDECDEEVQVTFVDGPIEYTLPCAPFNYFCTRTFTATDDAGNTATAVQYITVVDTIGPEFVVTLESNLVIDEALGETLPSPSAYVQDACDLTASWTSSDVTVSSDAESTVIQRTYTAMDACGNATVFVQTITVLHAIMGCVDSEACNFDADAELDDGSCEYALAGYDCLGTCLEDADGDGVCDAFEIVGCSAENACNYNPFSTDDGPCDFCSCNGEAPAYGLDIEVVTVHTEGLLAGQTTYRMYATTEHADDFVSSVFGNSEDSLEIATSTSFYQHPGGSALGQDINPMLFGTFPELDHDSWVTIGLDGAATAGENEVEVIEGLTAWSSDFESGDNLVINDEVGGLWYIMNGSSNGIAGDDHRVLIGQFTTSGLLEGVVHVQVFVHGVGENELRYPLNFANSEWSFSPYDNACGCTDMEATNYDDSAEYDDDSCTYPVFGCTDELACNFDPSATDEDETCVYAEAGYDCSGACLADADGDGICDDFEIPGCTDVTAINFNDAATDDDGTCYYELFGCTDSSACNYNPDATDDDGACDYAAAGYDCEGICLLDADGDGVCDEFEVAGCTDINADNYNSAATDDDGSCFTCDVAIAVIASESATCYDSTDGAFSFEMIGSDLPSLTWDPMLGELNGTTISGLSPGVYTLSASDTLGCLAMDTVEILSPEPVLLEAIVSDPSCNGGENGAIQMFANGGAGSYQFSLDCIAFDENDTFVGLTAGDYTVCAQDASGCTATWTGEITEPEAISIVVVSANPDLNGEGTGSIDISVMGGTPGYSFAWTGLDGMFMSDEEDLSGLSSGTYSLTVTDDNGCMASLDGVLIDAVGVLELNALEWSVFPNPTQGVVSIELSQWTAPAEIRVIDGAGRAIWNSTLPPWSGVRTFDFSHLAVGWYLLTARSEQGAAQARLLIER